MYEYKTQKELYLNLVPALNVKLRLLKNSKYLTITKEDIWNYLKENKWKTSVDLTLADMVQDIIHVNNDELAKFLNKEKLS